MLRRARVINYHPLGRPLRRGKVLSKNNRLLKYNNLKLNLFQLKLWESILFSANPNKRSGRIISKICYKTKNTLEE